jgi:GntR family transcriptional repressor for pyruvate dehydrogenase complex
MFQPVQSGRISNSLVGQIKDAIFRRELKPGDKLPSERQLMEQFQTSRVTVREALRTLEQSGILEIRRGVEGGAFVRDPNTKVVNTFLQDMVSMGNIAISNLTEARLAMEPFSVKVATERIRGEALEQIYKNIREAKECLQKGTPNDARLLNLEFHRLIAQASENPVILFLVDSIMEIMENNISSIRLGPGPVNNTLQWHEKIYGAMKNRDPGKAQLLMLKHIEDIQKALEALEKGDGRTRKQIDLSERIRLDTRHRRLNDD